MIPRSKSIFTVGEEGESTDHGEGVTSSFRIPKGAKPSPADLVGLRILIQCSKGESNVVIGKSTVRPRLPAAPRRSSPAPGTLEPSFLKACSLCKKELSPQKDVYMYRGDQGFCSEECRCRQILLDERRELEASTRKRLSTPAHLRAGHRLRESDRRRRILAVG